MANTEYSKVSVRILTKQLKELKAIASEKTCTYNYLIRKAIADLIKAHGNEAKR